MATQRACHFFQVGCCKHGKACNYAHIVDKTFKKKACIHFMKGQCRRGKSCNYSHDQDEMKFLKAANGVRDEDPQSLQNTESLFKDFRWKIPQNASDARPLTDYDLGTFFQQALKLVGSEVGTMQEVVTRLASDAGLLRVEELLKLPYAAHGTSMTARRLQTHLLPFFKVLTHSHVTSSIVLRPKVITLYNVLYSSDGTGERVVELFTAVMDFFGSAGILDGDVIDSDDLDAFQVTVSILSNVIEVNTPAHANPAFTAIVSASADVANGVSIKYAYAIEKAKKDIARSQQRLGIGTALPSSDHQHRTSGKRAVFHINHDMPGELSEEGRRHDNDHANIQDILIMPTSQEIAGSRNEYLPLADPREWHLSGVAGLVDRHFRLLREDTIGQLRDAAKIELAKLRNEHDNSGKHQHTGARTAVYKGVYVADVAIDEHFGLQFALRFQRPVLNRQQLPSSRRAWWENLKRLRSDALICLLSSEGSITFLTVAMETESRTQIQKAYNLYSDPEYAFVIAQPVDEAGVNKLLKRWIEGVTEEQLSLVEFPGILLPTFVPTLSAMKRISNSLHLPFADILAPSKPIEDSNRHIDVQPPAYTTRPGFRFNLACLLNDGQEMSFAPGDDALQAAADLHHRSKFDEAQAEAIIHSLSHSLSTIQGPPGTGKSFTGVGIVRSLLANRYTAKIGPIIVVTFTNHALDQVLERLLEKGVGQIVRVGSRSKSEVLKDCTLHEVSKRLDATKTEKTGRWEAINTIKKETQSITKILEEIGNIGTQRSIAAHLEMRYPVHHQQLFGIEEDDEGFRLVVHRRHDGLNGWLNSGARNAQSPPRTTSQLHHADLRTMSWFERHLLYGSWCADIRNELEGKLSHALENFKKQKATLDVVKTELEIRALRQAHVIGLTTSGLARKLDLLRGVDAKVLICEEAGEVVEAHMLTALLPSIEHIILIGDHQQLRPHVQNYDLSIESRNGGQYALDMSLFERLVKPTDDFGPIIPCCTLEVQRRMHPSISRLVRETQYPNLQDGGAVSHYPEVVGMRRRLFWMHHEELEDQDADSIRSTSHTNRYEVDMTAALVKHIVHQGTYNADDIAVITPYLGQLRAIKNKLQSTFAIMMNERDILELDQEGDEDHDSMVATESFAAKGKLSQALRLATVDNFQGEEAKVIIVSLVRSNEKNKPGFLATPNRINVLLSRAQHGMYILGNANTTEHVKMWRDVLAILRDNDNFGTALELCCPRHPETPLKVDKPADFVRLSPEGGCDLACHKQLSCGHACVAKCHSDMLHSAVYCMKPCTRIKAGCDHVCPKVCGDKCDIYCQYLITGLNVTLDCGHTKTNLPCYQFQDQSRIVCSEPVERAIPGCDHVVTEPCYVNVDTDEYRCRAVCDSSLQCGHSCKIECFQCNTRENGEIILQNHGECKQICGRNYSTCKHACTALCHPDKPCPLCPKPCDNHCSHSTCGKICSQACAPCLEDQCSSGQDCPHSMPCSMPCAAPCDWLPCSRRCDKKLSCGCRCPSVCGETCPSEQFCQNCASEQIKSLQADLLMLTSYGQVDLDTDPCIFTACGHIFTLDSLDGTMGMSDHYDTDPLTGHYTALKGPAEPFAEGNVTLKNCPECRASLRSIGRYGRIVRRALLDEGTKRFTSWSNSKHEALSLRLAKLQSSLIESLENYRKPNQTVLLTGEMNKQLAAMKGLVTKQRYADLFKLIDEVEKFKHQVSKDELPYRRVHDLIEYAHRSNATSGDSTRTHQYGTTEIQPREHLLARNLGLRCYLVLLTDVVRVHQKTPTNSNKGNLKLDLSVEREHSDKLAAEASSTESVLQQVEASILWARFAALENGAYQVFTLEGDEANRHQEINKGALERLQLAEDLCEEQIAMREARASSTDPTAQLEYVKSLAAEAAEVRRMLKDGLADSEMRMVVSVMAKEFAGTGHWYRCVNGHPFTVGECGMPMQLATCPECGQGVGGEHHRSTEGVTEARDIEERFGAMAL